MKKLTFISIAIWCVAGCTTTPEVLQLSKATAANAGLLTQELQRYSEDEKRFATARTTHVQELENTLAQARERFELDRLYTRESVGNQFDNTEKKMKDFIAEVDKVRAEARASRVVVPVPETVSVDERVKELATLATSMASLAKEPDKEQSLLFLKGYVESVRDYVENAKVEAAPIEDVGEATISAVQESENVSKAEQGDDQ